MKNVLSFVWDEFSKGEAFFKERLGLTDLPFGDILTIIIGIGIIVPLLWLCWMTYNIE